MNLDKLLVLSYWFKQPFVAGGWAMWFFILTFLVLVLFGLIMKISRLYREDKWEKAVFNRFGNWGIAVGLVGLIWFFFRQERVAFFAWRFWLAGWAIWTGVWLIKNVLFTIKRVPVIRKEESERDMKKRYSPNK